MVWVPVVDPNPNPKLKINFSTELRFKIFTLKQKFHPKKTYILGLDSELNSIRFGIEINKSLKFLTAKNVWV